MALVLGCGDDQLALTWEAFCDEMSSRELQRRLDCGVLWPALAPSTYRSPLCTTIALSLERGAVKGTLRGRARPVRMPDDPEAEELRRRIG